MSWPDTKRGRGDGQSWESQSKERQVPRTTADGAKGRSSQSLGREVREMKQGWGGPGERCNAREGAVPEGGGGPGRSHTGAG